MFYLRILKSYLNLEKKKQIYTEKFNLQWQLVETYNLTLASLIKNFKDNKSYYIMLNIRFS